MGRHPMFMDWKIQYYEDGINLQIPLQIQCNLKQNSRSPFVELILKL